MRGFFLITTRELGASFLSFPYWALLAVVTAMTAWGYQGALVTSQFDLGFALVRSHTWLVWLTMLLTPVLTMRLIAEERHAGTLELLMTAPVSDAQVILGKYASSVLVFLTFIAPVWLIHLVLSGGYGASPDWGQLLALTVGLVFVGLVYLAVGLLSSALTSAQIWAVLLAFLLNLGIGLVGWTAPFLDPESGLLTALRYIDLNHHLRTALVGILVLRHLVADLGLVFLLLFWSIRVLESRKWR